MDKNVNQKGTAGVSLVEIMISLVLVALALIAVTTVFPNIMGHRKGIHEAEQANIIAQEALEFIQYYNCADVNAGVHVDEGFTANYGSIDMGSAVYTVSASPCSAGDINTVNVEVAWTKGGKNHKVTVTGALR